MFDDLSSQARGCERNKSCTVSFSASSLQMADKGGEWDVTEAIGQEIPCVNACRKTG